MTDNIESLSRANTIARAAAGGALGYRGPRRASGARGGAGGREHANAAGALAPRLQAAAQTPRRTRWWVDALVIVWLLWMYDAINNLAHLRLHVALANARGVLSLERMLHLNPEHALDHWLASHHTLAIVLANYYDNAHFVITLGLLGWLWWRRADIYRSLRNALVLTNVFGFAVFWLYPVAPPRMLGGFTDVVSTAHAFGDWHAGSLASHANQLAAMPSLHMAWAGWCALALWRASRRRWIRVLALAYPCLTAVTVLATGNHFVLDLFAGLLVLALALVLLAAPARLSAAWRRCAGVRLRWLPQFDRSGQALGEGAVGPAYRMSQTCYEVREQVE